MPGFNLFYNLQSLYIKRREDLICDSISGDNFQINRFTLNKFLNDKIFIDNNDLIIVLEGIVLNKAELLAKYHSTSWTDLIYRLFKKNKEFFKEFRGSFSGVIYDKIKDELFVYTDQLGSKHLYYYINNSSLLVSSEISDLYTFFKAENIKYDLDIDAAYSLLSYGYMLNNSTLCGKVKNLEAGTYIHKKDDKISFPEYYKLPLAAETTNLSESEIIERIDTKFRNAIKLQFDKDNEYSYRHFVALSGGLDSRMTSWVAHDMGYVDQLNFTFSQSNYLDETIPKKIASDLKHDWIFKALDNGNFLKDIEEITLISGGNALYYGLAHGNSMLKIILFNNLGIVHSGQLGDIVIGSFIKNLSDKSIKSTTGAYSKRMLNHAMPLSYNSIEDLENKLIYQRGINGANTGLLVSQNYSETISPFYDIDFFEFCLSIPIKMRMNHNIYKKWILTKYPSAADYIWESTKKKITKKSICFTIKGVNIPLSRIVPIILFKLGLKKPGINSKQHMNPLDYWYSTNNDIKVFLNNYFNSNIDCVNNTKLNNDCRELYSQGGAIEKNEVLSLLAAIKIFFKVSDQNESC